jgi:hypothetical protein
VKVAEYDYGQFYLTASTPRFDVDVSEVVDDAIDAGGISQRGPFVVILSPFQWSWDMALSVELWAEAPLDDLDAWQEAFEFPLDIVVPPAGFEPATPGLGVRISRC